MKIRSKGTLIFGTLVGVPSALFLGWDGLSRGSDIDILFGVVGLLVFLRVIQGAISQKVFDADMARLEREKIVRYATYGRMAKVVPYIPAIFLIMIFMAPVAYTDNPMMSYVFLGLAVATALPQVAVYCYGCHKMGLWKKNDDQ